MRAIICALFLVIAAVSSQKRDAAFFNFTESFTALELIEKDGYPGERYTVETSDGYILGVYHIPYGRKCGEDQPRKAPVLVWHGLLSNSIDFLITGPNDALGYILADNCYDVWLANSRGTFESQEHITYPVNSSDFWKFSWHEMGAHDLPAVIDFVLEKTGKPSLHYIGHSQGTTSFFIYASSNPLDSYRKVASMHALAPIAYMENMTSPLLRFASRNIDAVEDLFNLLGWYEFLPPSDVVAEWGGEECSQQHPNVEHLCENVLFILCGFDPSQMNHELLPVIMAHDPAGASTKQIIHYGQEIVSAKFRQYDHGTVGNILHYGRAEPPEYKIKEIRVPLYLHYADNDWLASTLDVEKFAAEVPNTKLVKVPLPTFNHLDFLWAINVTTLVYDTLLEELDSFY